MYTEAMEVRKDVNSMETKFTPLLSRMSTPEIFFTVGPGFPTTCTTHISVIYSSLSIRLFYMCSFKLTLFRTEQNPLNWMVAPSTESIRLPHNPANAETGMTKSCFRATSLAQLAVKNPKIRNVTPTVVPAAKAAKSPAFVTPPFVPFFTG